MRLLVATTNSGKLREIRALLGTVPVDLLSLRDFPAIPEPEETGATFQDNARLKALYYDAAVAARAEGGAVCTVAEDSGLAVDAMDGGPGVHSARFLRPDATYRERFDEILRRLAQRPSAPRTARFICALCVVRSGAVLYEASGVVEGVIAEQARGTEGFGYDPIFLYPPFGRTLGEIGVDDKLRIAHRGHAFRLLAEWLSGRERGGQM